MDVHFMFHIPCSRRCSAHQSLSRLVPLLTQLDMSDPQSPSLFDSLALIRSRFKTLIVMMNVHAHFKRQEEDTAQRQGQGQQTAMTANKDMSF